MPRQQVDAPRGRERELLPDPFWAADNASLIGQRRAVAWYRAQILLVLLAALVGIFSWETGGIDFAPLAAVLCFLAAGAFALQLRRRNPQQLWYDGRAAAESVKTLAWKYVVRAQPFDGDGVSDAADANFLKQAQEVVAMFADSGVFPPGARPAVSDRMRRLRAAPLQVRRDLYLRERVLAQRTWYQSRAQEYESKSSMWGLRTLVLLLIGAVLAFAETFLDMGWHALGLVAAGVTSITAWSQLKQFRPLAAAYRMAERELDEILIQLQRLDAARPDAEEEWAELVRDAEDAVSREHTLWLARRQFTR